MKRLALLVALGVLAIPASASAGSGASYPPGSTRLAPAVPCTAARRMDIFVDEDGIMYECQCQMLVTKPLCAWQVIGGTDPVSIRIRRKIAAHVLPRQFYYSRQGRNGQHYFLVRW